MSRIQVRKLSDIDCIRAIHSDLGSPPCHTVPRCSAIGPDTESGIVHTNVVIDQHILEGIMTLIELQ